MSSYDHSHRTPSPDEGVGLFMDDSVPGGDATSQGSPGSASDHMGFVQADASGAELQPMFPGAAALAAYDAEAPHLQRQSQPVESVTISSNGLLDEAHEDGGRRQKRLERNRESARLSRRRRKQYLEELEKNVGRKAEEVDESRRRHIAQAVSVLRQKRSEAIAKADPAVLPTLDSHLCRTNAEMMVATTFCSQQLKSFSLPPENKVVLWLSLQTDDFFRGGRAASERLSAARIGERVSVVADVRFFAPLLV